MAHHTEIPATENVYWKDLEDGDVVRSRRLHFVVFRPNGDVGVLFWHGQEARSAQQYLTQRERWDAARPWLGDPARS